MAGNEDRDPALRVGPRTGLDGLARHLGDVYGVEVVGREELDLGVFRVELRGGEGWVVRVFPSVRPVEQARGDAEILAWLGERGYPAEQLARPDAVSVLDGQAVLVTEHIATVPRGRRRAAVVEAGGLRTLGSLLGTVQTLPPAGAAGARPGGAWHHLADGGPAAELEAVRRLLHGASERVEPGQERDVAALRDALDQLDDGAGLPGALLHPDFVMANMVAASSGGLVVVDWAGSGQGPRAWALAFLLFSVGFGGDLARVDRVVAGYRCHVSPTEAELARLAALIAVRPIVFEAWTYATGRKPLREAAAGVRPAREAAEAIADRARAAFAS